MKIRIFEFLLPVWAMFLVQICRSDNTGIIELVYTGDPSKPFPVLIFHLPGSLDTRYDSTDVHKFEISEEGFTQVRESLCIDNPMIQDTVLLSSYLFVVIRNGETSVFSTVHLKRIRMVFEKIGNQYKDSEIRKKVSDQLNSIIGRLQYELTQ